MFQLSGASTLRQPLIQLITIGIHFIYIKPTGAYCNYNPLGSPGMVCWLQVSLSAVSQLWALGGPFLRHVRAVWVLQHCVQNIPRVSK